MEYLRSQRIAKDNEALMAELGRSYSDIASYLKEFKLDDPYVSHNMHIVELKTCCL